MPQKEVPTEEVKTFTEEEVNANYVPRAAYDDLAKQNERLGKALNKLFGEYNELHSKALLGNYFDK